MYVKNIFDIASKYSSTNVIKPEVNRNQTKYLL